MGMLRLVKAGMGVFDSCFWRLVELGANLCFRIFTLSSLLTTMPTL